MIWKKDYSSSYDETSSRPYVPTSQDKARKARKAKAGKVHCTNCGLSLEDKHNYCPQCGKSVSEMVQNSPVCECGAINPTNAQFCFSCGKKIT